MTREGCIRCLNGFTSDGAMKCRKKPHDYNTLERRMIVQWLTTPGRVATEDSGCFGFVDAAEPHKSADSGKDGSR